MKNEIKSWIRSLLIAVVLVVIVRAFLFAPYVVEGESMEPTLHNHDKILVYKFNPAENYQRGDIVIIKDGKLCKENYWSPRGNHSSENDKLYIDGKLHKEPYLAHNLKTAHKEGSNLQFWAGHCTGK